MESLFKSIGLIISGLLLVIIALFGVALILAVPVMWLWNWVIVDIFQLPEIGYWKAFGLYLLSGLLVNHITPNSKKN
jgi:hypothetical protein